ncbi:MAG: hypothetical protein H6658_20490 [Ardenticatenaceae bacterium]|nr:hypothetical protein [Ardenticatenaceae bacterium]
MLLGLKKRGFGAGEDVETAEMKPIWFAQNNLPLAQKWQDALLWLPLVLAGKPVTMTITLCRR